MHRQHIGYIVRTLNNKLTKHLLSYEALNGIDEVTSMHGWILGYLYEHQDIDIFQKDIEADFDMNRSTTTGILNSMEQRGYIKRISVKSDRRLKKLLLTDSGIETHLKICKDIDFLEQATKKNIKPDELLTFIKVAEQMEININENIKNKFSDYRKDKNK